MEKNELELIQSYLTEEEAKVIIPQYEKNFDKSFRRGISSQDLTTPHDLLNFAFDWSKTDQKHYYWESICKKIKQRYIDGH